MKTSTLSDSINTFLSTLRNMADPLVDGLVAQVFAQEGEAGILRLANEARKWGAPVTPENLPPGIYQFLAAPVELPSWMKPRQIRRATKLFREKGPLMLSVMMLAAIPESLFDPGFPTALVAADALQPGTLMRKTIGIAALIALFGSKGCLATSPTKGAAIIAIQKLRIFHAITRFRLQKTWDDSMGKPINQADLAQIQLTLAMGVTLGVQKLNVRLSKRDKNDILLIWAIMAYLLGVHESLIPRNVKGAKALWAMFTILQSHPNEAATTFMDQLFDIMKVILPPGMYHIPAGAIRFFIGDPMANALGVPPPSWMAKSVKEMCRVMDHFASFIIDWMAGMFGIGTTVAQGTMKMLTFPAKVAKSWHVDERLRRAREARR